jgi:Ran GTPase-activating protein (RanGAP) involved in mRNA processing and transport
MTRSHILLSAFALSSAALLSVQTQETKAMNIAFDCFERSSEKLVARSAVDMTSTTISCLPVPGTTSITEDSNIDSDDDVIVDNTDISEDLDQEDTESDVDIVDEDITDEDIADEDIEDEDIAYEDEDDTNIDPSTGSQLGEALGKHIGNLLVKGINDLFR